MGNEETQQPWTLFDDMHSDIRPVLDHWRNLFRDAQVVDRHEGFSGAAVMRIRAANQDFALRRWPVDAPPVRRLLGLHRLLSFARQRGLTQLSVPIVADNGATLVERERQLWQVEPWMPGEASFHRDANDEKLHAAMRTLARFHLATAGYRADDDHAEWFSVSAASPSPTVIERIRSIDRWRDVAPEELKRRIQRSGLDESVVERLVRVVSMFSLHADRIDVELQSLLSETFRLQPALRDVWHDHLLFEGNEVTGLIDASACRSENAVIDLARLLGSLLPNDVPRRQRALELYEQYRPLQQGEYHLLNVFHRSEIILSGMSWVQRLVLDRDRPHDRERIAARLDAILQRESELS